MSAISSKPRPAGVPLDDIIDFLASDKGSAHVDALKGSLRASGVKVDAPAIGPGMNPRPADRFEGLVTHALEGSFLLKNEVTAALPAMVGFAFAHAADEDGKVRGEEVQKILGPKAFELFRALEAQIGGQPVPTARRLTKYRFLPNDLIPLVTRGATPVDLKTRMPVLGEVTRMLGGPEKLAGLKTIAVQHLFPTTPALLDALVENGLDRTQALVAGKNYSTNTDVLYRLRGEGWDAPTLSTTRLVMTQPDGSEREVSPFGGYLEKMFEGIDPKTTQGPKFLVLDEGGKVLTALHKHFPEYAHLCVAVEHTDRGAQLIDDMLAQGIELKCPVVNVARSWAKKRFEAPMIGESVAHSIETALSDIHPDLKVEPKVAAIIGYGAVGKATSDALRRRGYQVHVYDTDPAKLEQARADGCTPGTREAVLAKGHLLVSCTGRTTITPEEYGLLPKGAILANAASGNHELGTDRLEQSGNFLTSDPHERCDEQGIRRTRFHGLDVRLGDLAGVEETFSRVIRGPDDAERLVLRSGFVVNLAEGVPAEYIQLTRSLILAAVLQAAQTTKPGLVDLSDDAQQFIVKRTEKFLKGKRLTLEKPDFRKLERLQI